MKLDPRTHDVISGTADLVELHSFKNFPIFMGSVTQPIEFDLRADMSWSISASSGTVQLNGLIPVEYLYQEQTTNSAVGTTWMTHHALFAEFISNHKPSPVFEIGGAHGILAREYQVHGEIPWTVLEPNPSPVEGTPAVFMEGGSAQVSRKLDRHNENHTPDRKLLAG